MRHSLPALALLALVGCTDSPTGITAGTLMRIGDQIAIEAALGKVADSLKARGATPEDTLLAEVTRLTARLVRLQGRSGALDVALPGGGRAAMEGVALLLTVQSTGTPSSHSHAVVAWEGLDAETNTVRRAVLLMADAGATPEGTHSLASGGGVARLVDLSSGAATVLWRNTGGSVTVSGAAFQGSCPGIGNTSQNSCTVGRETVGLDAAMVRDGVAGPASTGWAASVLPAFQLVAR